MLNRTKIIATLGPASNNHDIITQCILSGVNVFRLNMSHYHDKQDVAESIDMIRIIENGEKVRMVLTKFTSRLHSVDLISKCKSVKVTLTSIK